MWRLRKLLAGSEARIAQKKDDDAGKGDKLILEILPASKEDAADPTSANEVQTNGAEEFKGAALANLPDDFLVPIFLRLTNPYDAAACRLVCKRWLIIHRTALWRLDLREWLELEHKKLVSALPGFSNLRILTLPKHCLDLQDDADPESMTVPWFCRVKSDVVLHCVATSCPMLAHLSVDFHQRPDFGELALARLFRGCTNLQSLSMGNRQLAILPEAISGLERLRTLRLSMPHLRALPSGLGRLAHLRTLALYETGGMRDLGPGLAALTCLKELELHQVKPWVPDTVWNLTSLESLLLDGVWLPPETPYSSLGQLSGLTSLELSMTGLPRAVQHAEFGSLPALRRLHLSSCRALEDLSPCLHQLPALESLLLANCDKLVCLPEYLGHMAALRTLKVTYPKQLPPEQGMRELPDSFGLLSQLTSLELQNCSLTALPFSWREMSSLTELRLVEMFSGPTAALVGEASGSLGLWLSQLRVLVLEQADLEGVTGVLTALGKLEELRLVDERLHSLPEDFGQLTGLRKLELIGGQFRAMPKSFGQLCALQELRLDGLCQLASLPDSFGDLTALEHLVLIKCPALASIPGSLGNLSRLQSLVLGFCAVTSLPETLSSLSKLYNLTITHCPNLEGLPDSLGNLQSLRFLILQNLPKLSTLPESMSRLTGLRELVMEDSGLTKSQKVTSMRRAFSKLRLKRRARHQGLF